MVKTGSFISIQKVLKGVVFLALSFLFFALSAAQVNAATLQIAPSSGSYNVGQTFNARVVVDSGSTQVNAVEATVSFDTSVLSVVSISKNNSVINMWTTDPTHSNSAGTITFGGGNPSPFSGQSTLITVTFRVNSVGSGSVSFNSGQVTAADGTGRDIMSNTSSATFTGTSAPEPEPRPEPEPAPTPGVSAPSVPAVTSSTHPENNPWSNEYRASFNWHLPGDVNAVRLQVGRNSRPTPGMVEYDPPIDSRELDDGIFDDDGIWYFHVQFRNSAGWGDTKSYEFGFDMEEPTDFDVVITEGEGTPTPTLSFEAEDELSGIGGYIIRVDGMEPIDIPYDQHSENGNLFTFTEPLPEGDTEIEVTAYDNAGNETVSSLTLTVEDGDERIIPDIPEEEEELGFFAKYGTTLFIILLFLVIFGLLGYIWKLRKQIEVNKKKGKQETYEVRDEVSRVFSALRDEAEDLFAAFDGKEGLNAKEKEAFKKISDALDVSEEIIGKEIDDVEKLMQ